MADQLFSVLGSRYRTRDQIALTARQEAIRVDQSAHPKMSHHLTILHQSTVWQLFVRETAFVLPMCRLCLELFSDVGSSKPRRFCFHFTRVHLCRAEWCLLG